VTGEISERSFEDTMESALLQYGPDATVNDRMAFREDALPYGDAMPGGYHQRLPEDYDRSLCLIPRDVIDFVLATQPKEWEKLKQHYGTSVREQFLKRLSAEVARRVKRGRP
jgi:type I restriction enzyme R subunit